MSDLESLPTPLRSPMNRLLSRVARLLGIERREHLGHGDEQLQMLETW